MKLRRTFVLAAAMFAVSVIGTSPAFAQTVTTGSLAGKVADQQGGVLPGAAVEAVHTPTGTKYKAVTDTGGRYSIQNVRVGGPYTITVTMPSFKKKSTGDVMVTLGDQVATDFALELATMTEAVTVTGESPMIDVSRAGAAANISNAQKESLPTISRSLIDVVRVDPYLNAIYHQRHGHLDVGGRPQRRYNNMSIDGAVNNDLFGLSNGQPGGADGLAADQSRRVLEHCSWSCRRTTSAGRFTGGGVNAVTKRGSNKFRGSAFYFGRNQEWVGKVVTNTPAPTFADKQRGFSVGGPS